MDPVNINNSFADPVIQSPTFTIESGTTVDMKAGNSIVVKSGSSAQYGCSFHAYIDASLCTSGMRLANQNNNYPDNNNETYQIPDKKIEKNKLSIVPNPTAGVFSIQFTKEIQANSILQIINSLGSPVYETKLNSDQSQQIDASSLPPGLYYVRVQSGNKIYSDKVIVE
jgi:hypothetical protein